LRERGRRGDCCGNGKTERSAGEKHVAPSIQLAGFVLAGVSSRETRVDVSTVRIRASVVGYIWLVEGVFVTHMI
jgi:hypothetical protein